MDWYQRKYREDAAFDSAMRKVVEYDQLRSMKPPPKIEPNSACPPNLTQSQHQAAIQAYIDWSTDRAELRKLEECATASAVKVASVAGVSTALGVAYSRARNLKRGGTIFTVLASAAMGASLAFRQFGAQCGVDFLQSDGRIAAKGRDWLRQEYPEHPILKDYDSTHQPIKEASTQSTSESTEKPADQPTS